MESFIIKVKTCQECPFHNGEWNACEMIRDQEKNIISPRPINYEIELESLEDEKYWEAFATDIPWFPNWCPLETKNYIIEREK